MEGYQKASWCKHLKLGKRVKITNLDGMEIEHKQDNEEEDPKQPIQMDLILDMDGKQKISDPRR